MFKKLLERLIGKKPDTTDCGLGTSEIPVDLFNRAKITSKEFKEIVNANFRPKILELGFKGKDFTYFRENDMYSETIFFWTYKYGGAIAVDLYIKFKNIEYPDKEKLIKAADVRFENTEFYKRLSPIGDVNQKGHDVWFWILTNNAKHNNELVDDILETFKTRGRIYFSQFETHEYYINKITTSNYFNFPGFKHFIIPEREKIYFLFKYWILMNKNERAKEFALLGLKKLNSEKDEQYLAQFQNYLNKN